VQLLNSNVPGKGQGSFVHSKHVGDPGTLEYVPVPQSAQTVDDEAEYLPAPQSPQVEATLAPTASENLPAPQASQAVLTPEEALYLPALHSSHAVLMPAAALCLPASQLVQTVEPAIYVHTLSHTTKGGAR